MTEKQKEILKYAKTYLGSVPDYHWIAEGLAERFPEAFELKPERESIDVRIEFNRKAEGMLLSKSGLIYAIRKRVNDFCMLDREATVTELPAPEGNGWSDELVVRCMRAGQFGGNGKGFREFVQNFKKEYNIK